MVRGPSTATRLILGTILLVGIGLRVWYAGFGLRIDRFEDERHSWPNVQSILVTGTLEPAKPFYPNPLFNLPPALMIGVVERVLGDSALLPERTGPSGSVAPWALFVCRFWSLLCGSGAIALTFLLGRTLFSNAVGVLGSLFVAFSPFAIHGSGYFKPDALLLFTSLLAFLLLVKTVDRPTRAGFILCGVCVALVVSSKIVGLPILVPLAVATLAAGWHWRSALGAVLLAGTAAAIGFLVLNPYWWRYWEWLEVVRSQYTEQAVRLETTRLDLPAGALRFLLDGSVQSPWIIGAGLVGLAVLTVELVRRRERHSRWLQRLMFTVYPPAYVAIYALGSARFKGNNILPIVPFILLAAGWLLVHTWRWTAARWSTVARPEVRAFAALTIAAVAVPPGAFYTYASLVPTTNHLATRFLASHLEQPTGRIFYLEPGVVTRPDWEGWPRHFASRRAGLKRIENAAGLTAETLAAADGIAFPADRMRDGQGGLLERRAGQTPRRRRRLFRAHLFRSRGPEMVAIRQHKHLLGSITPLAFSPCAGSRSGCLVASLPVSPVDARWLSLVVHVAQARIEGGGRPPQVRIGNEALDLVWVSWQRRSRMQRFVSERFANESGIRTVSIEIGKGELDAADVRVQLCRWVDR